MNGKLEKIAVLVSVGRHPVSGVARYSRNDAAALEIGRALAARHGARCDVVHAGDAANPALTEYLALGAARVEVLACEDTDDIAAVLAARVSGYDLVLTGTRAEGAFDSGMLPYRLAHLLGYPLVNAAVEVTAEAERAAVRQFMPKGVRRSVDVALPAVVAVHPLAAATASYAYARLRSGAVETRETAAAPCAEAAQWALAPATRRPVRLAAAEKRSGHQRMLSATTTESRGGRVVIDGTSVEKAQVILAYLREHQLIDY
ncbi:drug:proton antiporter [Paraburkholderia acidipaludis]|uniref:drug:proton antiporter n=1 Tax=Paraburkholderia acidipaludis TaxID=660537 RepID=UPI0004851C57|nr:drug:proton antiporter [Paraburkholderia acidipaludis]